MLTNSSSYICSGNTWRSRHKKKDSWQLPHWMSLSNHEVSTSESLSINVILSAYGSHECALDPYAYCCQAAKRPSVGSFLPLHPARQFMTHTIGVTAEQPRMCFTTRSPVLQGPELTQMNLTLSDCGVSGMVVLYGT